MCVGFFCSFCASAFVRRLPLHSGGFSDWVQRGGFFFFFFCVCASAFVRRLPLRSGGFLVGCRVSWLFFVVFVFLLR